MISIIFYHSSSHAPVGFHIEGHSGYASSGSDIICASVSSAALMAANTLSEIMGIEIDATVNDDGEMTVTVQESDAEKAKDVLLGLELHLTELSRQYPKNVTITTEV